MSRHLNPLGSSILSLLIRQAPYLDYSSVVEERDSAIEKEISAAVNVYHPVALNYSSIFSNQGDQMALNIPIAPNIPIQPVLVNDIRNRFHALKKKLWLHTFLPRMSSKIPGKNSLLSTVILEHEGPFTYTDAEILYFRTGIQLGGTTEVRSAWKFNDLKPRVYYAQGFTQFHASKYIQRLFSMMVDLFDNTHTFGRFNTNTVELSSSDYAFIYDYSAFTSTLHELKNFTAALASFFRGVPVRLLDTYNGEITVDVGDLLDNYNEHCNDFAPIDVSDLYAVEEAVLHHNTGMLGVPGNITSSTLLHGIHLSLVLGSITSNKVVGDDAFGAHARDSLLDFGEIPEVLQNLGRMAVEKMESWNLNAEDDDPGDWHYLKRPIYRVSSRLVFGEMYHFPGLDIILGQPQPYRTYTYRNLPERVKVYASQLFYLFRSIASHPQDSELHSLILLNRCIKASHIQLGITPSGSHPELSNLVLPPDCYSPDWLDAWFESHDDEVLYLPKEDVVPTIPERYVGSHWYGPSTGIVSLFKKLQLVDSYPEYEYVRVADDHDRVVRFLERRFKRFYLFVVRETIPLHLWTPFCNQYALLSPPVTSDTADDDSMYEESEGYLSFSDTDS
jgi:hypothetical protein